MKQWTQWKLMTQRNTLNRSLNQPNRKTISRKTLISNSTNLLIPPRNIEFKYLSESLGSSLWLGFQSFLSFHFEDGQNFELLKSLHSVQKQISISHWQLSEIVTPESLVGLRHMGNRWKFEKVIYDVGIQVFLRLHSKLGSNIQISQDAKFCPEQNFSHPINFKSHNSWTVDRIRTCK
jgi:hypothetical protein